MNEALINKHIKTLGITRTEAIKLIEEDNAIDRMTKTNEINSDLSTDQQKNVKKARQSDRKPTVYKFDTTKREKKENNEKKAIIEILRESVLASGVTDFEMLNDEREFSFKRNNVKYKIVLSCPRN